MLHVSADGEVVLRLPSPESETRIEFASPRFRYRDASDSRYAHDEMVEYSVRLVGHGLSAQALVLSLDTVGNGLPAFMEGLGDEFRGWDGTRTWQNQDHDLSVVATWSSRGHVALRWQINPGMGKTWSASVVTDVEAGAELSALSRDLFTFFAL